MDVVAATRAYEDWLGDQLEVVSEDLDRKHKRMRESPFVFLRGSYYRWLQRIDALAPDLAGPQLACVGDLHVENFGTWRDTEGRLVWGINDFDESERLPYTYDLARLATSAVLAIDDGMLRVRRRAACDAVLDSYRDSLAQHAQTASAPATANTSHRRARRLLTRRSLATTRGARPSPRGRRVSGQAPARHRMARRDPGGRVPPPRAPAHTFTTAVHRRGDRRAAV
jgi:uncharacterized protein (DUF2252 family)